MTADAAAVCTVVSRSHLARATVLADSLADYHPTLRLHVLVTDGDRVAIPPLPRTVAVRRPSDLALGRDEFERMAAIYSAMELACALKPHIMRTLHAEGARTVLYLDADMLVLGPISDIISTADVHGIVLSPHLHQPTDAGLDTITLESTVLRAGWINGGIVATGPAGGAFLDWWAARLARHCRMSNAYGIVDQTWLAMASGLFPHALLRDPGINTAWWTLAAHPPESASAADVLTVQGQVVRLLHLSGYDPEKPYRFSIHDGNAAGASLTTSGPLRALCARYAASLSAAGHAKLRRLPYGFSHLASGIPYDSSMRRVFDQALADHEDAGGPAPPNPFSQDGGRAFIRWLRTPARAEEGPALRAPVGRYLGELWSQSPTLHAQYPNLSVANRGSFARYCVLNARNLGLPFSLLPATETPRREPQHPADGVALVGGASLGEPFDQICDAVRRTMSKAGERIASIESGLDESPAQSWNLAVLTGNATTLQDSRRILGPLLDGVPQVGFALWRGGAVPADLVAALSGMAEVWAPSTWAAEALASSGISNVWTMPIPVPIPQANGIRARLGLSDHFLLHAVVDAAPDASDRLHVVVDSFTRAFSVGDGAHLAIRLIGASRNDRQRERLLHRGRWRDDISVAEGMSAADADALLAESDCFVAADPATPTGFTVAKAMAAGALVMAPGCSGDATHMRASNSVILGPQPDEAQTDSLARYLRLISDNLSAWDERREAAALALAEVASEPPIPGIAQRLAALRASTARVGKAGSR